MILASLAVVVGVALLAWSAERFVEGSASSARHFGMPPLLIGLLVIGFGTSAPELVVSALAAFDGSPGIALGNAYGSNITNIALVLGLTALISPLAVDSRVLRRELPILTAVTGLAAWQLWDGEIARIEGLVLLGVFAAVMVWTVWQGERGEVDEFDREMEQELKEHLMPLGRSVFWLVVGLVVLLASSRLLLWGAVEIAESAGVSELIIGLTVVALGTSLPELASSLVAVRKGEHDIAVGNVIGSNLFNTLVAVGIAGTIHPIAVEAEVLSRDMLVMGLLTVSLFLIGYGFRRPGRINRLEGAAMVATYLGYTTFLVVTVFAD